MTVATEKRAPKGRAEDPWLTSNQAAEYLGFAPRTLARWRYEGIGPRYHTGATKQVRYRRSWLEAWAKKQGRT